MFNYSFYFLIVSGKFNQLVFFVLLFLNGKLYMLDVNKICKLFSIFKCYFLMSDEHRVVYW